MVDLLGPLYGSFMSAWTLKKSMRALNADAVEVFIISNNELFQANGRMMHNYVVSGLLERAIIPMHYVKMGVKRAIFVNESTIKYPTKLLYSLVVDRLVAEPRVPLTGLGIQFCLSFFAMLLPGAILAIIGWTAIVYFIIVYMIFKMVMQGVKYAR